ncbi:hypothetical protein MYRNA_75 [Mycobacterium phage Myrna]|uniref:Uncharacterized protein n=1 Tax=Mycobacterium phage Myrna TaxID=546805 RepID=B5LJ86_9CAUD|nr:gp75 [Mycobacterium phage Myrna]ACH62083.1 hypothetical protein MYRNA_75 [Mycobacterium phage Myrna]
MFTKKEDGTYRFSTRFWVYTTIATLIICWIGWRTQDTANRVENQVTTNTAFATATNDCLQQVIDVLTTRVGYSDEIAKLEARRDGALDKLIADLATSQGDPGLNMTALNEYRATIADVNTDQDELATQREKNQYPNCTQLPPQLP